MANFVMEMLPPAGVPELATKADLAVLDAKFEGLKAQVLAALEAQTTRYIRWNMVLTGAAVAIIGTVAGLA